MLTTPLRPSARGAAGSPFYHFLILSPARFYRLLVRRKMTLPALPFRAPEFSYFTLYVEEAAGFTALRIFTNFSAASSFTPPISPSSEETTALHIYLFTNLSTPLYRQIARRPKTLLVLPLFGLAVAIAYPGP